MTDDEVRRAIREGRPYFGLQMAAQQGPPLRKAYMRPLVRRLAQQLPDSPIDVLEFGGWAGAAAVAGGRAPEAEGRTGKVVCVDHGARYLDTTVNNEPIYQMMTDAV